MRPQGGPPAAQRRHLVPLQALLMLSESRWHTSMGALLVLAPLPTAGCPDRRQLPPCMRAEQPIFTPDCCCILRLAAWLPVDTAGQGGRGGVARNWEFLHGVDLSCSGHPGAPTCCILPCKLPSPPADLDAYSCGSVRCRTIRESTSSGGNEECIQLPGRGALLGMMSMLGMRNGYIPAS